MSSLSGRDSPVPLSECLGPGPTNSLYDYNGVQVPDFSGAVGDLNRLDYWDRSPSLDPAVWDSGPSGVRTVYEVSEVLRFPVSFCSPRTRREVSVEGRRRSVWVSGRLGARSSGVPPPESRTV